MHIPGRTAQIKLYQGKWTDGIETDDPGRFEIAKTFDGKVGVSTCGTIFGLVDGWSLPYDLPNARLTHMSYRLDKYFVPAEVIARLREPAFGKFLFNAGGMGMSALWVEVDDLEDAFRELGLL